MVVVEVQLMVVEMVVLCSVVKRGKKVILGVYDIPVLCGSAHLLPLAIGTCILNPITRGKASVTFLLPQYYLQAAPGTHLEGRINSWVDCTPNARAEI